MPHPDRPAAHRALITGFVFKLIRESIPTSQERLAAEPGVDRATVQSWESGRRPFTSVTVGQAVAMRTNLARLGADLALLAVLNDAAEADYLLTEILDKDPASVALSRHPLGWSVLTHTLTDLIAWAIIGQPPAIIAQHRPAPNRRGPVPTGPTLGAAERSAFFTNLTCSPTAAPAAATARCCCSDDDPQPDQYRASSPTSWRCRSAAWPRLRAAQRPPTDGGGRR